MSGVGITATRHGLTDAQRLTLGTALADAWLKDEGSIAHRFHHGDCVGGDVEGAQIARRQGYRVVAHPPINPRLRAYWPSDEVLPERDYHARNRAIVDASWLVIGCPDGPERDRSGTWSTIRYARQTSARVVVIMPDGSTA